MLSASSHLPNYTCPYDGFIYVYRTTGSGWTGTLTNSSGVIHIGVPNMSSLSVDKEQDGCYPVKKGMVVTINGSSADGEITAQWYELRDYTGR